MDLNQVPRPWQDRCSSITDALSYMLKKEIVVDAVFVKDKVNTLYAHKLVLSVWSPVFADLAIEYDPKKNLSIRFSEDLDVMNAILTYLYAPSSNKCLSSLPLNKLIQVIDFSKRYGMVQIYKKCLKHVQRRKISPLNVIEYFDYGLCKNLEAIVRECVKVFAHQGIGSMISKEGISLDTIIQLLNLERIAAHSEAQLLCLAISWLTFPENEGYKSEVLSLIDLKAIEWLDYQQILKQYPTFFSNFELACIFLGVIRQNSRLYPKWYKPKIISVIHKDCVTCVSVKNRLKVPSALMKSLNFFKRTKLTDLTNVCQTFEFESPNAAKLLEAELCFGPNEVPEKKITVMFNKTGIRHWTQCSVVLPQGRDKYFIRFSEFVKLNPGDNLTLKFIFREKSVKDNIIVISPNVIERQKLNEVLCQERISVKLPSKLACYLPQDKAPKLLVSSFNFNLCDHNTYLIRKYVETKDEEGLPKMDTDEENSTTESISMNVDLKRKWASLESKDAFDIEKFQEVEVKQKTLDVGWDLKNKGVEVKQEKLNAGWYLKNKGVEVKQEKINAGWYLKNEDVEVESENLDSKWNLKDSLNISFTFSDIKRERSEDVIAYKKNIISKLEAKKTIPGDDAENLQNDNSEVKIICSNDYSEPEMIDLCDDSYRKHVDPK